MVTEKEQRELSAKDTVLCTPCQMLVVWIQNQLKQQKTKEVVFNYVNQVGLPSFSETLIVGYILYHYIYVVLNFFT